MRTIDNFPLVSIIVPIYNVELYVKECILSVFAQDYQNIELIAVDDCGTDNSIAILEELFKSNPKNISCILSSNPQPIGFRGNLLVKRQKFFYCTYSLGITETS